MINLLPAEKKVEVRAGRTNVVLLNYVLMSAAGFALLLITVGFAYISLTVTRSQAQARVDENSRDVAEYQDVQKQADTFRKDLAVAKQILDKDISYSSLVLNIAKSIPNGIVLEALTLDQTTLGKPMTINARASSKDAALKFKSSLESQPELFDDIKFETISIDESGAGTTHPVGITMSIVIKKVIQ